MTPSTTAEHGDPPRPGHEPPARTRHPAWTVAGLGLAAGWGALTCYALMCLGGGPDHAGAPGYSVGFGPALSEVPSDIMRVKAARRLAQPEAEPDAVPPPPEQVAQQAPAPAAQDASVPAAQAPVSHPVKAAPPEYVGTWGPTATACASKARRRGFLPATIRAAGARAGGTSCTFRDVERDGAAWVMDASCADGERRWSSQVKLLVAGDKLTWSSGKGTSSYVRCPRKET